MKYQLALRDHTGSLGVLLPKQPRHFEQLTAFILQHLNRRISQRSICEHCGKKAPAERVFSLQAKPSSKTSQRLQRSE
jgi:hypothetical protein